MSQGKATYAVCSGVRRWLRSLSGKIRNGLLAVCCALSLLGGLAQGAVSEKSSEKALSWREGFADIIEPRLVAIVNISATTKNTRPQMNMRQFDDFLRDFFGDIEPRASKVTSLGSGFLVKVGDETVVVTNHHVVKHVQSENGEITIIFNSGKELRGRVRGVDPRSDIAVLKVETSERLPTLEWGNSDTIRVGNWVIAIGNPYGLGGSVSVGVVSNSKRSLERMEDAPNVDVWVQTDASVNQGNSGGPLLDVSGKVIGVNTAIFSMSGGSVGISFAIPSAIARPIVEELVKKGCVQRGWIGVRLASSPLTDEIAQSLGLPEARGALVNDVVPGGEAEKAGLKPGDIILAVGKTMIKSPRHLRSLISGFKIGTLVTLNVWRNRKNASKKRFSVKVTIRDMDKGLCASVEKTSKKHAQEPKTHQMLGLVLMDVKKVPSVLRRRFEWPEAITDGIAVLDIEKQNTSFDMLQVGDVILQVGQEPVGSPDELFELIRQARKRKQKSLLLMVWRAEVGRLHVTIPVEEDETD